MGNSIGEIYYQGGKARGKCSVCGTEETHTYTQRGKKNGKKFPKPFYFEVFEKVNWFRGDDEWLGRVCKNCIKAGRMAEATKQEPPTKRGEEEVDR